MAYFLACKDFWRKFDSSFPACTFLVFFFIKWRFGLLDFRFLFSCLITVGGRLAFLDKTYFVTASSFKGVFAADVVTSCRLVGTPALKLWSQHELRRSLSRPWRSSTRRCAMATTSTWKDMVSADGAQTVTRWQPSFKTTLKTKQRATHLN